MNHGTRLFIRIGSDAIGGMVTGGALGSLIGPRFAAIGAAIGFVGGAHLGFWGNFRRLWANVVEYFDVWQQLADANAENVRLDKECKYLIHSRNESRGWWSSEVAKRLTLEAQVAHLEADASEHARDAETIAQLRTDLNHLKHANEVMKGKYREACELLTHRNATCEHYRKMYGDIRARLCDGEFTVVDTAREGE